MSLGRKGMPLFGARVSDYSPDAKSGAVWIMGRRYTFDMESCRLAAGGHADVYLTPDRDDREPKPRTASDGPGESVVVNRTEGKALVWGYRPEPDLTELLSAERLQPHVGCTFVRVIYGWASSWDNGPREYAVGNVVELAYEGGLLTVRYAPRDGSREQTRQVKINTTASFEDLRGGGWGPVGRMIIEMEDRSAYNRVVLYEE